MILQYFVTDAESGAKVPVEIDKSTVTDLAATKANWQTDWTSEFIGDPALEKYTAKTDELAKHYIRDFGAIRVFAKQSGGPIMLMIADNAALALFNTYLS